MITRRPMVSIGVRARLVVVFDKLVTKIIEMTLAEGDEISRHSVLIV